MDIKITPATLCGEVQAISSKSDLHRALIAAALSDLPTKIKYRGLSEDIKATVNCLCAMGAEINITEDIITVIPITTPKNGVLDCNESGSTIRFLLPIIPALNISATVTGKGRLSKRPLSPLYEELTKKGCKMSEAGKFPLMISGELKCGNFELQGNVSSQFITGLMFALPLLSGDSTITLVPPVESKSYINLTLSVLSKFGIKITEQKNVYHIKGNQKYCSPQSYEAEGDWSNSAFWLCAGSLGGSITVSGLKYPSIQGDSQILEILSKMGADVFIDVDKITVSGVPYKGISINAADIPDLVPIIAVTSAFAQGETHINGAARLRLKESDRLSTVTSCLTSLGGKVKELSDGLIIEGKALEGGKTDSFGDHRIVMSAAIAASKSHGEVIIIGAEAADKSYPAFFADYKMLGGNINVL